MIKLKTILLEKKPLSASSSASDIFQDVVFGKNAFDINHNNVTKDILRIQGADAEESNTPTEQEILNALVQWVEYSTTEKANKLYAYRDVLERGSKLYPILRPTIPNGTSVYRGLTGYTFTRDGYGTYRVGNKSIDKLIDWNLAIKTLDNNSNIGKFVEYPIPIKYTPHRRVQSWTSDQLIAKGSFTASYMLTTKKDDNFLLNQNVMKLLYGEDQQEILHFGKEYSNDIFLLINKKIIYKKQFEMKHKNLDLTSFLNSLGTKE